MVLWKLSLFARPSVRCDLEAFGEFYKLSPHGGESINSEIYQRRYNSIISIRKFQGAGNGAPSWQRFMLESRARPEVRNV